MFCTPPPPGVGGGGNENVNWVARGLLSSNDGSIVALTLRWLLASLLPSGGDRGGGREARKIPGRGEEDEYRGGRKVQGGLDEAQCRQEEEEGGSGGIWARDGVPRAGGELGSGGRQRWPGTGRLHSGCPPVVFRRGRSLLPPFVDCSVPVDGDGSDGGD